jgi:hypothetical protein
MNINNYQGSAKIYQFPVRPRAVVAGHREGNTGAVSEPMLQSVCDAAFGDCWYHDTAVRQSAATPNS